MTVFKNRLPGTIRIKWRFAPSKDRIRQVRNNVIGVTMIVLAIVVLFLAFGWLQK